MLQLLTPRRRPRSAPRWRLARLAAVCGLGFVGGCSNDFFVCSSSTECTEAEGGQCEASGACSFPDLACPTGRRYGEAGNPQVAGTCVPPDDLGSTGTPGEDSSGTGVSSTDGATESTTDMAGTGTSTMGASSSDGSSTGIGASESSTGGEASSSSTGNDPPPPDLYAACDEPTDCSNLTCTLVTTLEMTVLAGFCTAAECRDPTVDCTDPGTGATPICTTLPLNGALGQACALDCGETGTAGCPEGMNCYDNIVGQPALCFHPL